MSRLEENKKKKREALLTTAFELFTEKGIQKTSISDIVNKAGVAKGTFYLYFSDKYDIHNKLIAHKSSHILNHALKSVEEKKVEGFEDQCICMVDDIITQLQQNKILLKFINKNLSWGIFKTAVTSTNEEEGLDVYQVYEEMIKNSGMKFKNPEMMIFMIIELVGATCYSTILDADPVGIDEVKPHLYSVIRTIIKEQEIKEG